MAIVKEVKKTLKEKKEDFTKEERFRELEEFFLEMQKKGLIRKAEYDLPLLDTLGHIYEAG